MTFDESDLQRVQDRVNKVIEELPDMVGEMTSKFGALILKEFRAQWSKLAPAAARQIADFKQRLERRWGDGLSGLRLLLELSKDRGADFHDKHRRSRRRAGRFRNEALVQLHLRGCQVAAEIIVLLENGFAKGAMARWRTLYEIATVATPDRG